MAALGRIAEELGRAMGGGKCDTEIVPQLPKRAVPSDNHSANASTKKLLPSSPLADLRSGRLGASLGSPPAESGRRNRRPNGMRQ
jgi:hypothetical protein